MKYLSLTVAAFSLLLVSAAHAEPGRTTDETQMRAGPGTNFPIVLKLPALEDIEITTCTNQWTWCEIQTQNKQQGWVMSNYLTMPFVGSIPEMGAKRGIPLVDYIQNNTPVVAPVYVPPVHTITTYSIPGSSTVSSPKQQSTDTKSVTTKTTTKKTTSTTVETTQDPAGQTEK